MPLNGNFGQLPLPGGAELVQHGVAVLSHNALRRRAVINLEPFCDYVVKQLAKPVPRCNLQ
eukprot:912033-Pyramimonas_sp.AAC.1